MHPLVARLMLQSPSPVLHFSFPLACYKTREMEEVTMYVVFVLHILSGSQFLRFRDMH
jgi:hypothetical protein